MLRQALRRSRDALLDLLFPPRCAGCRRLGALLCPDCLQALAPVGEAICVRCGVATTARCTCITCKSDPPDPLRGMRGVVFYGGVAAAAIQALKYEGKKQLAAPLGDLLVAYLDAHPLPFDCVTPAPLHANRLAERGFNQAELLARRLSEVKGLPLRTDLVFRQRHTSQQVHLNRQERRANMIDAFAPQPGATLSGERVLLIDDVCTSGATLRACGQALAAAGAGEIWALCVARAHPPIPLEPWQQGLTPAQLFMTVSGDA